ncbi:MAG: MTAP family purine nucleoside phosphorylase [Methanoculleaceae archaeon]
MLGIIGGTSLLYCDLPHLEKKMIYTPFGPAEVFCGPFVLLMRHQRGLPPHRINHRANLAALATLGVDRVISFGSAGSLKREIRPGSIVIPHDYISLTDIPTIFDHTIRHVCPRLSQDLRATLSEIVPSAMDRGVYVQTSGPRIETVAEIRVLSKIADVVGMTVASEATLANELDMEFAAICTIDNYAHGLDDEALTYDDILKTAHQHRHRTSAIMEEIIRRCG